MSNKQRYLQPVDTRQKVDLSDQTIQDIIQKHPLRPGNYSESSDSEDTTVDSETINTGVENSDIDMAVSKQEIEDLFKKFVKTRTKTIYALDPETNYTFYLLTTVKRRKFICYGHASRNSEWQQKKGVVRESDRKIT